MDLCIRHKEWKKYVDPCGKQQSHSENKYLNDVVNFVSYAYIVCMLQVCDVATYFMLLT